MKWEKQKERSGRTVEQKTRKQEGISPARKPIAIGGMSREEIDRELAKGYASAFVRENVQRRRGETDAEGRVRHLSYGHRKPLWEGISLPAGAFAVSGIGQRKRREGKQREKSRRKSRRKKENRPVFPPRLLPSGQTKDKRAKKNLSSACGR
ncbi:MAG: hypothetical protein ACI4DT_03835 [Chordicoccus sp.]